MGKPVRGGTRRSFFSSCKHGKVGEVAKTADKSTAKPYLVGHVKSALSGDLEIGTPKYP
jgi:hypothetical protein